MHIIYFSTITSSFDMDKKKQSFLRWVAVSSSYDETEIKHDNPDNSQLWDLSHHQHMLFQTLGKKNIDPWSCWEAATEVLMLLIAWHTPKCSVSSVR